MSALLATAFKSTENTVEAINDASLLEKVKIMVGSTGAMDEKMREYTGADAISKGEQGLVLINRDRCIECKECLEACPFGVMQYYDDQETAVKSDLCVERLNNEQVLAYSSVCPTGFILWGETKPIPDRLVGKPCHRISS